MQIACNKANITIFRFLYPLPLLFFSFFITFALPSGGMAEWSMAAVLKTVVRQRTGGSNPSSSANTLAKSQRFALEEG